MLLKQEFVANMSYLEPSINAMLFAGEGKVNGTSNERLAYSQIFLQI